MNHLEAAFAVADCRLLFGYDMTKEPEVVHVDRGEKIMSFCFREWLLLSPFLARTCQ